MPEVVTCPQCERQLRVPDELVGQRVKCPTCGTNFTATVGSVLEGSEPKPANLDAAPLSAVRDREAQFADADDTRLNRDEAKRRRALSSLMAPAICMLIMGILGLCVAAYLGFNAIIVGNITVKDFIDQNPGLKGQEQMAETLLKIMGGPGGLTLAGVFLLMSLSMIGAGIAMLTGRARWLAILGSILAMGNISCCCIFALPFGLWSLILLLNEDVKNSFR
jgi:predicted Zn finger-like uncharacterized protein